MGANGAGVATEGKLERGYGGVIPDSDPLPTYPGIGLTDIAPPEPGEDAGFVGRSRPMREVRDQIRRIATTDIPVLLLGETGTGKEVVARLIHKLSHRAHRNFLKVNCAALPVELLESELFGHEAGAFTGATRSKPGKFEICNHGTIFLDEIGEMPIGPQAKLLQALQDGEFSRLGSSTTTKVDVRILAATNVDIPQAIITKKFRADLFYRLNAFTIHLPPLRERKDDIPLLLECFMNTWGKLFGRPSFRMSEATIDACMNYSWPGNVREMENFVRRYILASDEAKALSELKGNGNGKSYVSSGASGDLTMVPSDLKAQVRSLKLAAEKDAILRALEVTNGCRKDAAKMLNISIRAMQYKIRECGIEHNDGAPLEAA